MSNLQDTKWFTETELPLGKEGVRIQVAVEETLYDERSKWGHIQVLKTPFYGKMLAIDGIIQTSESDEFIYHEMMTVLPGLQHGSPKKILIIGGGDGGALYQALRFKTVEKAVQVEINNTVTSVCREYLPEVSKGAFNDPRTQLVYMDGADYIKTTQDKFDVILLDLTDPIPDSPAEKLFENDFLYQVKKVLAPGGIISMQCGSLIFQPAEIKQQIQRFKEVFKAHRFHNAVVPGYQLTSFGFLMGSDSPLETLSRDELQHRQQMLAGENLYLSAEMYYASAVVPPYLTGQIY